ncbi:MAG: DUF1080 domain-containing protein [Phycisphaerae bacterium]|nr:DUF1080 domain-containing protein [Phycisphaerae bacterium]
MRRLTALAVLALGLSFASAQAADKNKTWTDPAQAAREDGDFKLQGEYTGNVGPNGGKVGAQVIALGNGQFRLVLYKGGLPGHGWDGKDKMSAEGRLEGSVVRFTQGDETLTLSGGQIRSSEDATGALKRIDRTSPTLGQKPPAGAVILFDGTKDALEKNWKKGARMTKDGLLEQGATSLPTFTNHHLHIEFRLPYKPGARGQGRGNSGIYVQGRHEIQMLDSFGLEGKHNECGGVYSVSDPAVNMCLPPLAWQTYDIEYTPARFGPDGKKAANARMTVRHNGVVVHDNLEIPKSHTTAAPNRADEKAPGPVYLQNHGNPVRYRNIWVVQKKSS